MISTIATDAHIIMITAFDVDWTAVFIPASVSSRPFVFGGIPFATFRPASGSLCRILSLEAGSSPALFNVMRSEVAVYSSFSIEREDDCP